MVPGQNGLGIAETNTPAGKLLSATIRVWALVAGLLAVHGSDEVSVHETISPFTGT